MAASDYLPVATGVGANVDSQTNFNGSGYQTQGFTSGTAQSLQCNKVWRQASMVAAAVTNFIVNMLGINVQDDGNLSALVAKLTQALRQGAHGLVVIAFSSTPTFDASTADTFEITLTANVTSSTLSNIVAGQQLTFIIHQDGVGSRTFAPPASLPLATIAPGANKTSVQKFIVSNALALYPVASMTVT